MLEDYRTAPIPEREKALFEFVERVNRDSRSVRREHVDAVREAGWTDEAIYDAITVCALFRFYNTWVDATGVGELPAEAYEAQAARAGSEGYDWAVSIPRYAPREA